jgi:hypothetical protein
VVGFTLLLGTYGVENMDNIIATNCAVCKRTLVDAVSVEMGIGPHCRKKYMPPSDALLEHRDTANKLVYEASHSTRERRSAIAKELISLGFKDVGVAIRGKAKIVIKGTGGGWLLVKAPYTPDFAAAMARIRYSARSWNQKKKAWAFHKAVKADVWGALLACYEGQLALGPKGYFMVERN